MRRTIKAWIEVDADERHVMDPNAWGFLPIGVTRRDVRFCALDENRVVRCTITWDVPAKKQKARMR